MQSKDTQQTSLEAGSLALWQWLGMKRFFPSAGQKVVRAGAVDYTDSGSFKIISYSHFEDQESSFTSVQLQVTKGTIVFNLPDSHQVTVLSLKQLQPMKPRLFPPGSSDQVFVTDRLSGHQISLGQTQEVIKACGIGCGGSTVIITGSEGTIWVWDWTEFVLDLM